MRHLLFYQLQAFTDCWSKKSKEEKDWVECVPYKIKAKRGKILFLVIDIWGTLYFYQTEALINYSKKKTKKEGDWEDHVSYNVGRKEERLLQSEQKRVTMDQPMRHWGHLEFLISSYVTSIKDQILMSPAD